MSKLVATVLTGFLGAGKTTLLNRIISGRGDEKIAVIVNEFGEAGIDGQLVVGAKEQIVELNNGCICCTVRSDLIGAVERILASGRPVDRIVIETTGLADPAPVVQSFMIDEVLRRSLELDAIVTVVDAEHVLDQLANEEAREQIAFADVIVLNKMDRAKRSRGELEAAVRLLNPLCRIVPTLDCAVDLDDVLDIRAFDLRRLLALEPDLLGDLAHEHAADITSVSITEDRPIDGAALNRWLSQLVQKTGKDLLRTKGIVYLAGEARRFVFHGVHMTLEGMPGKTWRPDEHRRTQIVFIGRRLDAAVLTKGLADCRAVALSEAS